MCGRYTLYQPWSEIHWLYNLTLTADKARNTQPRYNICPTPDVLFVTHSDDGMKLQEGRWGSVPFWAKELGNFSTFNTKRQEADKKSMFREAVDCR
jgi:putative SOS response-associated peptidase YedK